MAVHDAESPHTSARDRLMLEPMPFSLLDEPLAYISADHFRQRCLCGALKRFAACGEAARAEADMAIGYLERDLRWHHDDEDRDLFPALRRRVLPQDELGVTLARLTDDHRATERMVDDIVEALAAQPADKMVRFSAGAQDVMRAYAATEHKHLAIENSIVLAIARIRLTKADLAAMSRSMKERRGA